VHGAIYMAPYGAPYGAMHTWLLPFWRPRSPIPKLHMPQFCCCAAKVVGSLSCRLHFQNLVQSCATLAPSLCHMVHQSASLVGCAQVLGWCKGLRKAYARIVQGLRKGSVPTDTRHTSGDACTWCQNGGLYGASWRAI